VSHTNTNFTVSFTFIIPEQLLHIVKMEFSTMAGTYLVARAMDILAAHGDQILTLVIYYLAASLIADVY
jgi:hypothetical protein